MEWQVEKGREGNATVGVSSVFCKCAGLLFSSFLSPLVGGASTTEACSPPWVEGNVRQLRLTGTGTACGVRTLLAGE